MSTILIVDDERLLREGMKALLVGEGFDVRLARDGEECLRKIEQDTPDLVLLDVMLPGMYNASNVVDACAWKYGTDTDIYMFKYQKDMFIIMYVNSAVFAE